MKAFSNAGGLNCIEVNGGKCLIEASRLPNSSAGGGRIFGTGGELYLSCVFNGYPQDNNLLINYSGSVKFNADGYTEF